MIVKKRQRQLSDVDAVAISAFRQGGARPPTQVIVASIDSHREPFGGCSLPSDARSCRGRPTESPRMQQSRVSEQVTRSSAPIVDGKWSSEGKS